MNVSADDEFLLSGCLKHDRTALEKLSSAYGVPLYGFLRSALGKRADLAHALLPESIVDFLRSSSAFNLSEPIRVTLCRSILKKLDKRLKRKNAEGPLPGLDSRLLVLFECLCRLSWEDRILLLLRDQMNFSFEEMEAVLSQSQDKVRSGLKDARLRLRKHLLNVLNERRSAKL